MKTSLFLIVFLFICSVNAQEEALTNVVPPSPNAASLGQYVDVPVSTYTGVPSISIPIYTAKSGNIQLPISLGYHASGIRVAQESSWVGLGWALNAGGVITRQKRGLDDFKADKGFVRTGDLPPSLNDYYNTPEDWSPYWLYTNGQFDKIFTQQDDDLYRMIGNGAIDGEPDIFSYNFLGYSGKMVFKKQGNLTTYIATTLEQNNLQFLYTPTTKEWEVTDGNGWKFFFGTGEETINHADTGTETLLSINTTNIQNTPAFSEYISTWYIDKITTPEGHEVTFEYDTIDHRTISQVSFNIITASLIFPTNLTQSLPHTKYTASMQETDDVYLKKINFDNGYMLFNSANRTDIRTLNSTQPQRLDNIEVFDSNANLIKKIELNQSYFNPSPTGTNPEKWKRLRLNEVTESYWNNTTASFESKPPFVFTYDETDLPAKTDLQSDYWGYVNSVASNTGNNGQVSFPVYDFVDVSDNLASNTPPQNIQYANEDYTTSYISQVAPNSSPVNGLLINGIDRNVNPSKIQAGILKSITYPTGGKTKFLYEPNDYYGNFGDMVDLTKISLSAYDYPIPGPIKTETFTLTEETTVSASFEIFNTTHEPSYLSSYTAAYQGIVAQLRKSNGKVVMQYVPNEYMEDFIANHTIILPAGDYVIEVDNMTQDNLWMDFRLEYVEESSTTLTRKLGGGIRIASVIMEDKDNDILRTDYSYLDDNGNSAGRLMTPIKSHYIDVILFTMSNTVTPMGGSAQGSPVGYDKVTVSKKDTNGNSLGSTVYEYENNEDWVPMSYLLDGETLPGVPSTPDLRNGKIRFEKSYNNLGTLMKSSSYWYDKYNDPNINDDDEYIIKGLTNTHNQYLSTGQPGNGSNGLGRYQFYHLNTEWWNLTSKTDVVYDKNGNNPITTIVSYNYDNPTHKQLTKTTTTNSKGETITNETKYAEDLNNTHLISNHMHNIPLWQQQKVDGSIISTTETEYAQTGLPLPTTIKTAKGGQNLEPRVNFISYDSKGNPTEVSKEDGMHISYIWGHDQTYPVAKIENATRAQIEALSGFSSNFHTGFGELTALQETTLRSLTNAMVTTYTYDPLIGMTSMTDPKGYTMYYEYDEFNRLKRVKDEDGNILSENKYHYKGQ